MLQARSVAAGAAATPAAAPPAPLDPAAGSGQLPPSLTSRLSVTWPAPARSMAHCSAVQRSAARTLAKGNCSPARGRAAHACALRRLSTCPAAPMLHLAAKPHRHTAHGAGASADTVCHNMPCLMQCVHCTLTCSGLREMPFLVGLTGPPPAGCRQAGSMPQRLGAALNSPSTCVLRRGVLKSRCKQNK